MFKSEKHLKDTIKKEISKNPNLFFKKKKGLATFMEEELSLGHGIADLVISYHERVKKRKSKLNLLDINLLILVQTNEVITFHELELSTKISRKKIVNAIKNLENEGFVKIDNQNIFSQNRYTNYQAETFAIEIKIKNWQRALIQAYRYRNFASHSYVFMDANYINPAIKNKDLFLQYNVGLASVSKKGNIEIIYRPNKGHPFDYKMNMLLNESIVNYHLSSKNVNQGSR